MKDFIIDFETLSTSPNAKVATLGCVVFDSDPEKENTTEELLNNGLLIKFNIKQQTNRDLSKDTIDWIKGQPNEVKQAYIPSSDDVSIKEGLDQLYDFLISKGVDPKKSHAYCRGPSFDFPIFESIAKEAYPDKLFPAKHYRYYNQRDVRTRIEALLLKRDLNKPPMPKGIFVGLFAHNCLHDCIMDVMRMKYAECYARSLKEVGDDYEC